jgi:hypothetical protein
MSNRISIHPINSHRFEEQNVKTAHKMRLRETVHPPAHYQTELLYQPTLQRALRSSRSSVANDYVGYNPNLPPAAFPTLDELHPPYRPQAQREGEKRDKDVNSRMSDKPIQARYENMEAKDNLQDTPDSDIENYLASNGPQNPTYAGNMARMAQSNKIPSPTNDGDVGALQSFWEV